MKRRISIFLLIACLLLSTLVGCAPVAPPIDDSPAPTPDTTAADTATPNADAVEHEIELFPCIDNSVTFTSLSEMKEQLTAMKALPATDARYAEYAVLNTQNLSHYYAPSSAIVSNYDFEISRINPNFLWYVYNTKDKGGSIEFEICRIPADDPLLEIEQRYGQQRQNGIVAVPHRHEVYFVIDDA